MDGRDRPSVLASWWSRAQVPGYTRRAYLAPALVSFMFVGHAWEDAGWQGGAPYAFVLVLSLVQLARPTVLGWVLTVIPFLLYLVLFFTEAPFKPIGDWVVFLLVGLVPALMLAWARPRTWTRIQESGPSTGDPPGDEAG